MFATHPQLQVKPPHVRIAPTGRRFGHEDACRVVGQAMRVSDARRIVIDLERAEEATTSAFAQLVLLRRELLRAGRDLCVTGLRSKAAGLFEVNRLGGVLPVA
jgi:anti-anti-sigma regulatory factor